MQVAYEAVNGGGVGQTPIAHQVALPGPADNADFWDVGDPDFVNQQLPQGGDEFSELVAVETGRPRGRVVAYVLLAVVLALTGWGAYDLFVQDQNPLDDATQAVTSLYDQVHDLITGESSDEAPPAPAVVEHVRRPKPAPAPLVADTGGTLLKVKAGNPYWYLPNRLLGARTQMGRMWTPEEEETLRAGLAHRFTYQRYKTVQDVRKAKHAGSEEILHEALTANKLWTRMFAVIGLAEMNDEVPYRVIMDALKGGRSELVANFFERFVKHANSGQLYVLREAVRGLDARGRIVCLRGIFRSRDALRDVYLAAATLDPDRHVQAWLHQALLERPLNPDRLNDLLAMVKGKAPADSLLHDVTARAMPKKPRPQTPQTATEDDLDATGAMLPSADRDDAVEFYDQKDQTDEATKPALDVPDPDTFEYKN